eukprot:Blabericola_migrator_1__4061@NODE_2238_length_3071_cov_25_561252_g1410_i0_p2_GENE_NODE_2238_length_3071_cov_25_561252_g1410_i0NODE_2238_length_3071_cov_25_561252_g1410_i0_p2_ORF_typecomplete_len118_score10_48DUF2160/PF09928_9/0_012PhoR/PF11808_8/0_81DUF3040/PF11239_8/3_6_NODE_2238_length_3071_cov_25_561252_g1410_i026142967
MTLMHYKNPENSQRTGSLGYQPLRGEERVVPVLPLLTATMLAVCWSAVVGPQVWLVVVGVAAMLFPTVWHLPTLIRLAAKVAVVGTPGVDDCAVHQPGHHRADNKRKLQCLPQAHAW